MCLCQKNGLPTPVQVQLLLPYNPLVLHIPDSYNWAVRTQVLTILWILHLRDHQCHPCRCHPVSLCPLLLSDHPQQHIIHYLITYLQAYLLHPLPARLPFLLPPHARLSGYRPLLSPIPWSLFWFQTPFGWSIGPSFENDSEVVWTVVDSLLGGQLPPVPLIYSSLHWLTDRGGQRSPKQINTFFFFSQRWGK